MEHTLIYANKVRINLRSIDESLTNEFVLLVSVTNQLTTRHCVLDSLCLQVLIHFQQISCNYPKSCFILFSANHCRVYRTKAM
jgi:hypothetical protein